MTRHEALHTFASELGRDQQVKAARGTEGQPRAGGGRRGPGPASSAGRSLSPQPLPVGDPHRSGALDTCPPTHGRGFTLQPERESRGPFGPRLSLRGGSRQVKAGLPRDRKVPRRPRPGRPAAAERALTREHRGAGGPRGRAEAPCSALNILQGRVHPAPPGWDPGRGRTVAVLCPPEKRGARTVTGGFVARCGGDWPRVPGPHFPASFASLRGQVTEFQPRGCERRRRAHQPHSQEPAVHRIRTSKGRKGSLGHHGGASGGAGKDTRPGRGRGEGADGSGTALVTAPQGRRTGTCRGRELHGGQTCDRQEVTC